LPLPDRTRTTLRVHDRGRMGGIWAWAGFRAIIKRPGSRLVRIILLTALVDWKGDNYDAQTTTKNHG
jgi:hypothetical protein